MPIRFTLQANAEAQQAVVLPGFADQLHADGQAVGVDVHGDGQGAAAHIVHPACEHPDQRTVLVDVGQEGGRAWRGGQHVGVVRPHGPPIEVPPGGSLRQCLQVALGRNRAAGADAAGDPVAKGQADVIDIGGVDRIHLRLDDVVAAAHHGPQVEWNGDRVQGCAEAEAGVQQAGLRGLDGWRDFAGIVFHGQVGQAPRAFA